MELYIIRHGQSANNALADESQRSYDPGLTEKGKQQAQLLADFLAERISRDPINSPGGGGSIQHQTGNTGFNHLYCSAMHRALLTAAPVGRALGIKPEVWIDIHEQGGMYLEQAGGYVGYPGRTRAEILSEFPDYVLPETITDRGWFDKARGHEAAYEGAGRAIKVALELRRRAREEASGERIAIITHGTFTDMLIKALLGQLPNRQYFFVHYNTGITRIDFDRDLFVVRYVNRIEHLPPELIT